MPDVATRPAFAGHVRPLVAAASGLVVSLHCFLEDRLVQLGFGEQLLQPLVLLLQFLQTLCLFGLHPTVLISPTMERLFTDLQNLHDLADRLTRRQHRIRFSQLPDDLLRRVPLSLSLLHRESPSGPPGLWILS